MTEKLDHWHHDHTFGQDERRPGETRTLIVIALTAVTMLVEIVAGIRFGSMALLADGLHMGSHAAALAISAFAYAYTRRHARDRRFSFGTGKVNALGGFTGALLLAIFALFMAFESVVRLVSPVPIEFNQAIAVAVLGLLVNGISVFILDPRDHGHSHGGHAHDHQPHKHHSHGDHAHSDHSHSSEPDHHQDHNLRSAYLHVMADTLTSLLAIVALLSAKYFGWIWMDPMMGVVGALLIARWSYALLGSTGGVLLDHQAYEQSQRIKAALEDEDCRVTDLHVWSIGPGIYAAQIAVLAEEPASPDYYKARALSAARLVHLNIEVNPGT